MTHGIQLEFRKTIKITQELIDNGIKSDSSACMVAEAIKIEFPSAEKVSVDIQTIRLTIGFTRYVFLTPKSVQLHIKLWDMGEPPPPFSFQLNNYSFKLPSKKGQKRSAGKATVVQNRNGSITRLDGRAPPTLGGNRRVFGIRGLSIDADQADRMIASIEAAKRRFLKEKQNG